MSCDISNRVGNTITNTGFPTQSIDVKDTQIILEVGDNVNTTRLNEYVAMLNTSFSEIPQFAKLESFNNGRAVVKVKGVSLAVEKYDGLDKYVQDTPDDVMTAIQKAELPPVAKSMMLKADSYWSHDEDIVMVVPDDQKEDTIKGLRSFLPEQDVHTVIQVSTDNEDRPIWMIMVRNPVYDPVENKNTADINSQEKAKVDDVTNTMRKGAEIWRSLESGEVFTEDSEKSRKIAHAISKWLQVIAAGAMDASGKPITLKLQSLPETAKAVRNVKYNYFDAYELILKFNPQSSPENMFEEMGHIIDVFAYYNDQLKAELDILYAPENLKNLTESSYYRKVHAELYTDFAAVEEALAVKAEMALTGNQLISADRMQEIKKEALIVGKSMADREIVAKAIGRALHELYAKYETTSQAVETPGTFHAVMMQEKKMAWWKKVLLKIGQLIPILQYNLTKWQTRDEVLFQLSDTVKNALGATAQRFFFNKLQLPLAYSERQAYITGVRSKRHEEVRKAAFTTEAHMLAQRVIQEQTNDLIIESLSTEIRNMESQITTLFNKSTELYPELNSDPYIQSILTNLNLPLKGTDPYILRDQAKDILNNIKNQASTAQKNRQIIILLDLITYLNDEYTIQELTEELKGVNLLRDKLKSLAASKNDKATVETYLFGGNVNTGKVSHTLPSLLNRIALQFGAMADMMEENGITLNGVQYTRNIFNDDPTLVYTDLDFTTNGDFKIPIIALDQFYVMDQQMELYQSMYDYIVDAYLGTPQSVNDTSFMAKLKIDDPVLYNDVKEERLRLRQALDNYKKFKKAVAPLVIGNWLYIKNRDSQGNVLDYTLEDLIKGEGFPSLVTHINDNIQSSLAQYFNLSDNGDELFGLVVEHIVQHTVRGNAKRNAEKDKLKIEFNELLDAAYANASLRELAKKHTPTGTIIELLQEFDKDGNKTQNWLNPWELQRHKDTVAEFRAIALIDRLKEEIKTRENIDVLLQAGTPEEIALITALTDGTTGYMGYAISERTRANLKQILKEHYVEDFIRHWKVDDVKYKAAIAALQAKYAGDPDIMDIIHKEVMSPYYYYTVTSTGFYEKNWIPKRHFLVPSNKVETREYYLSEWDFDNGVPVTKNQPTQSVAPSGKIIHGSNPVTVKKLYTSTRQDFSNPLFKELNKIPEFKNLYTAFIDKYHSLQGIYLDAVRTHVYEKYKMPGQAVTAEEAFFKNSTVGRIFSKKIHTAFTGLWEWVLTWAHSNIRQQDYTDMVLTPAEKFMQHVVPIPQHRDLENANALDPNSINILFNYIDAVDNYKNKILDYASLYSITQVQHIRDYRIGKKPDSRKTMLFNVQQYIKESFETYFYNREEPLDNKAAEYISVGLQFVTDFAKRKYIINNMLVGGSSAVAQLNSFAAERVSTGQAKSTTLEFARVWAKYIQNNFALLINQLRYDKSSGLVKGMNLTGKLGTIAKLSNIYDQTNSTTDMFYSKGRTKWRPSSIVKRVIRKSQKYFWLNAFSFGANIEIAKNFFQNYRMVFTMDVDPLGGTVVNYHMQWMSHQEYLNFRASQNKESELSAMTLRKQFLDEWKLLEGLSFYDLLNDNTSSDIYDATLNQTLFTNWIAERSTNPKYAQIIANIGFRSYIDANGVVQPGTGFLGQQAPNLGDPDYNINSYFADGRELTRLGQQAENSMKLHNLLLKLMDTPFSKNQSLAKSFLAMRGWLIIRSQQIHGNRYDHRTKRYVTNGLKAFMAGVALLSVGGPYAALLFLFFANVGRRIYNKNLLSKRGEGGLYSSPELRESVTQGSASSYFYNLLKATVIYHAVSQVLLRTLLKDVMTPCEKDDEMCEERKKGMWMQAKRVAAMFLLKSDIENLNNYYLSPLLNLAEWPLLSKDNTSPPKDDIIQRGPDKGEDKAWVSLQNEIFFIKYYKELYSSEHSMNRLKSQTNMYNNLNHPINMKAPWIPKSGGGLTQMHHFLYNFFEAINTPMPLSAGPYIPTPSQYEELAKYKELYGDQIGYKEGRERYLEEAALKAAEEAEAKGETE